MLWMSRAVRTHAGFVGQEGDVEWGSHGKSCPCRVALGVPRLCWLCWAVMFVWAVKPRGRSAAVEEPFCQQVHDPGVCFVGEVPDKEAVPGKSGGKSADVGSVQSLRGFVGGGGRLLVPLQSRDLACFAQVPPTLCRR